jgi:hypothetical protein
MSVEGLRAWIGEVERKLGKRTRVFLALTVVAIGIAAASLYLAIDTRNSSVSEADVQALQEKLETRIDEVAAGGTTSVPPVEVEPPPVSQPEEAKPKPEGGKQDQGSQNGSGSNSGTSGGSPGGAAPQSSSGGGQDKSAKILELLERAKKQNAEAEAK